MLEFVVHDIAGFSGNPDIWPAAKIFIYAVDPIGLTWKYKQNENLINKKETHTHSEISEIERK